MQAGDLMGAGARARLARASALALARASALALVCAAAVALTSLAAFVPAAAAKQASTQQQRTTTYSVSAQPASGGALAAKKKKQKKPAVTRSASAAFAQASNASATAACPKGTHISGGGFTVSPNFTPPGTGLRSMNSTSHPSGNRSWTGGGSAYATPTASGGFTTFARCESNAKGQLAVRSSSSVSISPGAGQNMIFNCPPTTHVLTGGYAAPSLGAFAFAAASARIVVLASRRTGTGQWTISAYNNSSSPAAATLSGYVVCALNGKGRGVSQASAFQPVVNDSRTSADATCTKKQYAVGGGFVVSPATFPGSVPFVGVDEFQPVGKRGWHTALHEFVPYGLPPGSTLQTIAYCKKA